MTLMNKLLVGSASLLLPLLLACGGGGGGGNPPPPAAPVITTQPASVTVLSGATATFTVAATGSSLAYQWNKNTVAIAGATAAQFTTGTTVAGDNGASYTVTVSNGGGSVTSSPAILTVQPLATTLTYTDPTTGTYKLVRNAASTSGHLVLDLIGPAATTGTGVTATFSADTTKVTWANVASTDAANTFVQNGTAFNLGTGAQILKGKVTGTVLQVAAAQKGIASPVALNVPLLRIALDLKASQTTGTVTLSADSTKCLMLDGTGVFNPITVTVGTLTAQ